MTSTLTPSRGTTVTFSTYRAEFITATELRALDEDSVLTPEDYWRWSR